MSGRDVTLSWGATTNALTYTIARTNTIPGGLSTTVHGSCAGSVAALTCTDTGLPINGTTAATWTYADTPTRYNWVGTTSAASATVVVPDPTLSLASSTFTTGGGTTPATVANFFDNEGVTYCVDSSSSCPAGMVAGTDTVPASGGTKTSSLTIPAGLSVGPHTMFAIGSVASKPSAPFVVTPGTATKLAFTTQPGGGPNGAAWSQQPVVAVQDALGNTVTSDNSTVTLAINSQPGSGATLTCTGGLSKQAVNGVATFAGCQIVGTVGSYTLVATDGSLTSATSNPFSITFGTATQLVFTQQPIAGASGAAFSTQPIIKVEDSAGNVVTSSTQTVILTPSGGTLSSCAGLTASSGEITVTGCTFAGLVGTGYTLTAQTTSAPVVSGTSASFSPSGFGTATQLVFTQQPIAGASGAAFNTQPIIKVEDSGGNVVTSSGQTVTLTPSGGTLSSCAGLTAVSGVVTVTSCTFAGTVGTPYHLTASATSPTISGTSANFSPSGFGTATQLVFTQQPIAGASGAAFSTQPIIKVEDSGGNVVTSSGQTVTLTPSGGTLSSCAGLTASSGVITVTSCTFAGTVGMGYTLTAQTTTSPIVSGTSASFSPSGFGTATQLVFTQQPIAGASGAAFSTQPIIKVEDSAGNVVTSSGQTVTLTPSGGTLSSCAGLTAVSGVVTVTSCTFAGTVGTPYHLTASATSPTISGTSANFSPSGFGTATQLVFTQQPIAGASGAAFSTQPIIKVEDSAGNVVTSSTQTVTLTPSGGTLSSCAGLTAVSGVVTVTSCTFAGTVGTPYHLTASATSPTISGTSANFSPSGFGTATQLVFTQQPIAGASGAAFSTQPIIKVEDSAGNVVTSSGQTVTLTPSGGTLSSCAGLTAVSGVVTVTGCTFAGTVGTPYHLTASATSPTISGTSANFSPSGFGTATQLVFTTSPNGGGSGAVWTTQPVVTVEDSGGNTVNASTSITLAINTQPTGTNTLACTTNPQAATAGVDTFAGCKITGTAGSYTLKANGGGLTQAISSSFSITAAGVTITSFTTTNQNGTPQVGDTLVITFSGAVKPSTICSAWTTAGAHNLGSNGSQDMIITLTKNASGNNTLTMTDTNDCPTLNIFAGNSLNLGTTGYVTTSGTAPTTAVFSTDGMNCNGGHPCSNVAIDSTDTVLTITLGHLSSGTVANVASNPGVTYTPNSSITDAGGTTVTGSATDSAAKFF